MVLAKLVKSLLVLGNKIMKFNIYNKTTKQPENGVYADSPQFLRQLYAMNGEDIEIISASNENPENNLGILSVPEEIKKMASNIPSDIKPAILPPSPLPLQQTIKIPESIIDDKQLVKNIIDKQTCIEEKIFIDNGIEYKVNNEGSFKKSWVDVDPKIFRVINTESNKEVKLTNKKIQTLDWVKIG
jgi:hypothetical protein